MIYLDSAATTPIAPEVLDAMLPYLKDQYGNAGTTYALGRAANEAVWIARKRVSQLVGCQPENVVFTSGGSEANSLVFHGLKHYLKEAGKTHILVSAAEHDSVLRAAKSLIKEGFHVETLPITKDGSILPEIVLNAIRSDTGLVSVMHTNNETGSVNPIAKIGAVCKQFGVLFHTDCVQAAGFHDINVEEISCGFASISSHKLHGPKGVGALIAKRSDLLSPIIYGGSAQEFGLRGGTENVAGIVGFGKACELASQSMAETRAFVIGLKTMFFCYLLDKLRGWGYNDCIHANGRSDVSNGKILSLRIDGVDAGTLLIALDLDGVCISAGSACRSHELKPSHVLKAMGFTDDEARSTIRVSFSAMNTKQEILEAAEKTAQQIKFLKTAV